MSSVEWRYDPGMTVKITVSLPDELAEDARAAVDAGRASSVSAYVAMAMRAYAESDSWDRFMADMTAKNGHPSAEDIAWAREALGLDADDVRSG